MKRFRCIVAAATAFVAAHATAFEYNVTRPAFRPRWSGAVAGEWTMDRKAAFAKAKSEGAYTIVMFTGSWWCPYCENLEAKVLTSQAWADYVDKRGYYLAECDYPYRFPVPEGQEWKGTSPLGDGWGFQCWLYDAAYLAENGLTAEDGLAAIQAMYDYQDAMALPGSTTDTISRYGGGTMELHKIKYPTMILFRPDGTEAGRVEFPTEWYKASAVSDEEAINYIIGNLEILRNGSGTGLYENPTEGGFLGTEATQYLGWIADGVTGEVAGTITVKAAKANKKTGLAKLTVTIVSRSGGKVNLKGTAETPSTNKVFMLTKTGSAASAGIKLGANGLVGYYNAPDGKSYAIQGGRNVFSAKDADSKARAAALVKGFWPVVFETADNGGSAFADGHTGLSATVGNKGVVRVSGTLGDGNKVNISAQAIMGESGKLFVPIIEKKGAFSFLLEFVNRQLAAVTGLSAWVANGRPDKFIATWSTNIVFSAVSGVGTIPKTMYLEIMDFDAAAGIGGKSVTVSPANDMVTVARNKWTGTKGKSDLNATFTPKAGTFKGTFNFYVLDNGRSKKLKATVSGVVVDGIGYGTAVIKGIGTLRIRFLGSNGSEGGSSGSNGSEGGSSDSGGGESGCLDPSSGETGC